VVSYLLLAALPSKLETTILIGLLAGWAEVLLQDGGQKCHTPKGGLCFTHRPVRSLTISTELTELREVVYRWLFFEL